jgi:hypothetical protein
MISCWFHKKVIAHSIDAGQALPERTQRHAQNCPACCQSWEIECELTRQLAAGAGAHRQPPSPFLHAKIMASLDRPAETARTHRNDPAPIWAAAVIIGVLGIFGISFVQHLQRPSPDGQPKERSGTLPQPVIQKFAQDLSAFNGRNVFEWSKTLDQPLEIEMQSVVSDAKTALQLLAQNFLPELK